MTPQTQSVFDAKTVLPDEKLSRREQTLLGFGSHYDKVQAQLRLLLNVKELAAWGRRYYGGRSLPLCDLITQQYPLVIFHGDVGTGKTETAECIANRLISEAGTDDSLLFKLSTRVRGSGKVGEMGTLLTQAFHEVVKSAGQERRALLVIDEGDSLAASRTQEQSHHEDKVAVNTLIQCIDDLRGFDGRIVVFLCTNRLSVLDPALLRRAAVIEEFKRPSDEERLQLFRQDLEGIGLTQTELNTLVTATGPKTGLPGWTYSDIRTRLYPAALAKAFPHSALCFHQLHTVAQELRPSPVMEDK